MIEGSCSHRPSKEMFSYQEIARHMNFSCTEVRQILPGLLECVTQQLPTNLASVYSQVSYFVAFSWNQQLSAAVFGETTTINSWWKYISVCLQIKQKVICRQSPTLVSDMFDLASWPVISSATCPPCHQGIVELLLGSDGWPLPGYLF